MLLPYAYTLATVLACAGPLGAIGYVILRMVRPVG